MGYKYNIFTNTFDIVDSTSSWKPPVADESDLPLLGNSDADARVVLNSDKVYLWDEDTSAWIVQGYELANFGVSPNDQGISLNQTTTSGITTTYIEMEPTDGVYPGGVSTTTQTFGGDKTIDGTLHSNGSLSTDADIHVATTSSLDGDVTAGGVVTVTGVTNANGGLDRSNAGTLAIGTTNATIINIGNPAAAVNITGTVTNASVTNLNVKDSLITLNDGGAVGSASGSGFELEENNVATGYVKSSSDRLSFRLKAPASAGEASIVPGASGIVLDQSSHNPITFSNVGSTPNSKGASLSTQDITLQPADGSNPGLVTSGVQTIGGAKTFTGNISAANLSGSNSGDVTVTDTNSIDLSISGQVLSADVKFADATIDQNSGGIKVGTGSISNTHVNASAAIAYSKLNLSSSIVNTDVASGAAIAVNKLAALTSNKAIVSNGSGIVSTSATTDTQISYLSTTTSDVQTQLNNKLAKAAGDLDETSFSMANNASGATVTGFLFPTASVRGFEALVTVYINATTSLYETFKIMAINNGSTWQLYTTFVGDDSLVDFTISITGQVRYSSGNYSGFTSGTMKFRATSLSV